MATDAWAHGVERAREARRQALADVAGVLREYEGKASYMSGLPEMGGRLVTAGPMIGMARYGLERLREAIIRDEGPEALQVALASIEAPSVDPSPALLAE